MTGDVRRRAAGARYGRRGRSGDPEYGIKSLLVRNLEHLSPAQSAKIMSTPGRGRRGQEILAAWIAKERTPPGSGPALGPASWPPYRILTIGLIRQAGYTKIAATIRKIKHDTGLLLAVLGLSNP